MPLSAMQNVMTRNGCSFSCGWLPPDKPMAPPAAVASSGGEGELYMPSLFEFERYVVGCGAACLSTTPPEGIWATVIVWVWAGIVAVVRVTWVVPCTCPSVVANCPVP